jgi:hypothetical protein
MVLEGLSSAVEYGKDNKKLEQKMRGYLKGWLQ